MKKGRARRDNKEMFFNNVFPEPNTGCWLYSSKPNSSGYGRLTAEYFNGFNTAHRFSYFVHFGDFDRRMLVLHKCDNPACVNPEHLWLGTNNDNMADMVSKKRSAHGIRNSKAKLTEQQVIEIRNLSSQGLKQIEIRSMYNIGSTALKYLLNGKTWRHI